VAPVIVYVRGGRRKLTYRGGRHMTTRLPSPSAGIYLDSCFVFVFIGLLFRSSEASCIRAAYLRSVLSRVLFVSPFTCAPGGGVCIRGLAGQGARTMSGRRAMGPVVRSGMGCVQAGQKQKKNKTNLQGL